MTEQEQWKQVPGYEGLYAVSSLGRFKSLERFVKGPPNSKTGLRRAPERILNYKEGVISLWRDNKGEWVLLSRLVLQTFVGPCPKGEEARHLNGISSDCRLANLAWGTSAQNKDDKRYHGTIGLGTQGTTTKFTPQEVNNIRTRHQILKDRVTDIANDYPGRAVLDVIYCSTWVPEKYLDAILKQIDFFERGNTFVLPRLQRMLAELKMIDPQQKTFLKAEAAFLASGAATHG